VRRSVLAVLASLLAAAAGCHHGRSRLPVIEVPAASRSDSGRSDLVAVVISGDGGWADLVSGVANGLAAGGVRVVGVNALRYFWTERTPDEAGRALREVLAHHAGADPRERGGLVGYSRGADVLPFMVRRLPRAERHRLALVALLGPGSRAAFGFHVLDWLREKDVRSQPPVVPEIEKLAGVPLLCVYGTDEPRSACPALPPGLASLDARPGDHHLGRDPAAIAQGILAALDRARAPTSSSPSQPSAASRRQTSPSSDT